MIDIDRLVCDLYELKDIDTQTAIIDEGVEFVDVQEVILTFNEERAGLNIEL